MLAVAGTRKSVLSLKPNSVEADFSYAGINFAIRVPASQDFNAYCGTLTTVSQTGLFELYVVLAS